MTSPALPASTGSGSTDWTSNASQQPKNGDNQNKDETEGRNQFLVDMIQDPKLSSEQDPQQPPLALAAALAFVFGSQILLFLFLSMDDTTANQVLTELSTAVTDPSTGTSTTSCTVAEAVGDLMSLE